MELSIGLSRMWETFWRPMHLILSRKKNNSTELKRLLKRLVKSDDPVKVNAYEKQILRAVNPKDFVTAVQKLQKKRFNSMKLQKICSLYTDLIDDRTLILRKSLPAGHIIKTLLDEHETILCFLDDLDFVNQSIQVLGSYNPQRIEFRRLTHIAKQLMGIEQHNRREEEILMPELEKHGLYGPPMPTRDEEEEIRRYKQKLLELSEKVAEMDFKDFAEQLDEIARFLVPTFQEHIFKVNNILFPTALEIIDNPEVWSRLKEECDKIGYCCFTPTE